jgi:hypothetical protein
MRHMVRHEKLAAWLEEGGEDVGGCVYIRKVVIGLRALWESRTNREDDIKIG